MEGYANFYNDDECLFSVPCKGIKQAEDVADKQYMLNEAITDWSWTKKPVSKTIKE